MAVWWKPWTWGAGESHADNFIRNWQDAAERHGIRLNEDTALKISGVLCATRVIAEGIAQLPCKVLREEEVDGRRSRQPAVNDPVYNLLHRRPNEWMTSFEWRETMTMHAVLTGNAYSLIDRVDGRPDELIPLMPNQVEFAFERGRMRYKITTDKVRQYEVPKADMFHLRGPSMDGRLGLPVVRMVAEGLGLALDLERGMAHSARKNSRQDGVITLQEGSLPPEAKADLRDEWVSKFGPGGTGGVAVLDKKWTFHSMSMSATDQQVIENRRFQIDEIGRAFRVWPLMLMQADKTATFASSEQFFLAHLIHTLGPWIERWEQALDRDLISDPATYAHFQVNGMMRGAAKDRADFYAKALGSPGSPGYLTQNEIRGLEDYDPVGPEGDVLFTGSPTVTEEMDDGTQVSQ